MAPTRAPTGPPQGGLHRGTSSMQTSFKTLKGHQYLLSLKGLSGALRLLDRLAAFLGSLGTVLGAFWAVLERY